MACIIGLRYCFFCIHYPDKTNKLNKNQYIDIIFCEWVGRSPEISVSGGKSEQDRVRWWLMTTRGDPRESAAESTQPMILRETGNGEKVR